MKKVFLDDLPKYSSGAYKGKINWSKCIGCKVRFIYGSIDDFVEIVQYNIPYITIKYNGMNYSMTTSSFLRGSMGLIIGKIRKEYLYNVGDIINTKNGQLEILEQVKVGKSDVRGYKYKCKVDNYINITNEYNLKNGQGCPVCVHRAVKKGVNDIYTTHPELRNYFVNIGDSYKYSKGSDVFLDFKCPNCGYVKSAQIKIIVMHSGFVCPQCGDGKSYPEKFILNLLKQLKVNFIVEYSPKWIAPKRYDFYLPDYKTIIEVHGEQHYTNSFKIKNTKTLNEEINNDEFKYKKALENGINQNDYIIINAQHGECEWIKNSAIKSNLSNKFNLNKINWLECNEFATCSIVRVVCDIYNSGVENIDEIADSIKIHRGTVTRYLNRGFELGWCDYSGQKVKESHMKKVICLNDLKVFQSIKEASGYIGKTRGTIHAHLRKETKSAGKHPETGERLRWMYYDDYVSNILNHNNVS